MKTENFYEVLPYLNAYCKAIAPSTNESEAQYIMSNLLNSISPKYTSKIDSFGNLIYKMDKENPKFRLGLFAHADEITSTIINIKGGKVFAQIISGNKESYTTANIVVIGISGTKYKFTPIFATKALQQDVESVIFELIPKDIDSIEGVKSGDIVIGCTASLSKSLEIIADTYIKSKALDNRLGGFIAYCVCKELLDSDIEVTFVNTVMEEVGHYGIKHYVLNNTSDTDLNVALDTTNGFNFYNRNNAAASKNNGLDVGGGIVLTNSYNFVTQRSYKDFYQFVKSNQKYKMQNRFVNVKSLTDADELFIKFGNTILLQIPIFGMHSANEMAAISDIIDCINIIKTYSLSK